MTTLALVGIKYPLFNRDTDGSPAHTLEHLVFMVSSLSSRTYSAADQHARDREIIPTKVSLTD